MHLLKKVGMFLWFTVLAVCFLLGFSTLARADDVRKIGTNPNRKLVRIGYPIQSRITDKTEDGEYTGYNVDYLQEVCKYTNWEIEYVEVEGDINTQLTTLTGMLETGEIDMMGTMVRNEYLEEIYLYPTYSYGSTYTTLAVAEDSHFWFTDFFGDWNGMTVATYPGLERRMELLESFAQSSGFTYETVEYETIEEVVTAVLEGEVDACLQVDISICDGLRSIARFNPSPYYFALHKDREDLAKELDGAMYSLQEFYPSLQNELYSVYFTHKGNFHLSEEDHAWLKELEPLRVMYYLGSTPIQDGVSGKATGVAALFMKELCDATGLRTVPVFAESYEEGEALVKAGKVDMIASMTSHNSMNMKYNIRLSSPYFASSSVRVNWGDAPNPQFQSYYSVNTESTLSDLKWRGLPGAKMDSYCVDYYMRKEGLYDKMHIEWADRETLLYAVGILPSVDSRLVDVVNGFAGSLDEQQTQSMLYEASKQPLRYTPVELLVVYKWQVFAVSVVAIVIGLSLYWRRRNRIIQDNAREAERLYQFSCMVNACLLRYDLYEDRLIIQNSKIMFKNGSILDQFLATKPEVMANDENELRCVELLQEMFRNRETGGEIELKKDGPSEWYRIDLVYINDEYAIGRIYDICEEVEQRNILELKAKQDALTGLVNRFGIREFLEEYLAVHEEGIFLLMDLDNFKQVNDTLGHLEGDKVLQEFAEFVEKSFRDEDLKVRLGGDEFVVFMPREIPREALGERLAHFRRGVMEGIFSRYSDCNLSVSVGAAYVSDDYRSLEELYRAADIAMYAAKGDGKNRCCICRDRAAGVS
ncbi:MAG: GGDEF domain-containing protein [Eubacteriales bacterium]|nr:GGDEF domain-containing protein [Eubacteriales bacterium]